MSAGCELIRFLALRHVTRYIKSLDWNEDIAKFWICCSHMYPFSGAMHRNEVCQVDDTSFRIILLYATQTSSTNLPFRWYGNCLKKCLEEYLENLLPIYLNMKPAKLKRRWIEKEYSFWIVEKLSKSSQGIIRGMKNFAWQWKALCGLLLCVDAHKSEEQFNKIFRS